MPGVRDVDVVLGSGGRVASLEPEGLVIAGRRTRTSLPYAHIRDVRVEASRVVGITLRDGAEHRTPEDSPAALTAFVEALRQRVAAAGTPGPATPEVAVVTLPGWRPDLSGRKARALAWMAPYFAALTALGAAADKEHLEGLILGGMVSLLSFLVLSFCVDVVRDRLHLRRRGVTVRVAIGSGRVSNGHYRVHGQRFVTVDGRGVTAARPLDAPRTTSEGDMVDVRYDPGAPATRVRIGADRSTLYGTLPVAFVFGVMLALPVVIAVVKTVSALLR